jgi:hypothetical protein
MTYDRFEDTPAWQAAIALAHGVFDLVEHREFGPLGDLRNQLQRASLSISNNIAEGFERGTTAELIFLPVHRPWLCRRNPISPFIRARPKGAGAFEI